MNPEPGLRLKTFSFRDLSLEAQAAAVSPVIFHRRFLETQRRTGFSRTEGPERLGQDKFWIPGLLKIFRTSSGNMSNSVIGRWFCPLLAVLSGLPSCLRSPGYFENQVGL